MKFRKDINGLRAIAVIAVVLFHFNASWMPGGFAGVDVFFVISGFLMTSIIFRGIEQDKFSILNFYVDRANRIIPTLAVLCLVLLIFGWFYLAPLDYRALGKHVSSSIGFLSNIVYWTESGYFDEASHGKWLLHTWSLSTEWQFYIIYPLVLVIMRQFMSIRMMKVTVLLGTILGFVFCIFATYKWSNFAYYLLPARAWEMMIGGVAYLYPFTIKNKRKKTLELVGLGLIVGSYFFISKDNHWPGYLAVFPVLGSFLIIQAQRHDSLITGNFIFQKIGTWSYSIYLWHWPLVVAIYYLSLNDIFIYIGIILSVFLGFLSNKYIEKIKFKRDFSSFLGCFKCKPLQICLIVGVFGSLIFITNGFVDHYSTNVKQISFEAKNKNPYKCMVDNFTPCYIGNKENIKAIVVGDSHADALTTSLAATLDLELNGIIALTKHSCPFILNIKSENNTFDCLNENTERMRYLNDNYKGIPVFWISRTGAYLYGQSNPARVEGLDGTKPSIYFTKKYKSADEELYNELEFNLNETIVKLIINHPVYLVQPTPEMRKNIPKTLAKNILLNRYSDDLSINYDLYLQRNNLIRERISRVAKSNAAEVLDPIPYLCSDSRCIAQYKNRPIYYDGDHMSEFGNKLLTPMFSQVMYKHLQSDKYYESQNDIIL